MEPTEGVETPAKPLPSKPRRRFVGTSTSKAGSGGSSSKTPVRRVANLIPDDILHDPELNAAIAALPGNYNFEIHKTIHHIRRDGVQTVALQMPEGLMVYGCAIADIVERFTGALPLLLADVTYGACCIDDYTAREMGAEMIVHYGHSCLIPVSQTSLKTLYVFVEIVIDTPHLALSVRRNFPSTRSAFERVVLGAGPSAPGAKVPISLDAEDEVLRDTVAASTSVTRDATGDVGQTDIRLETTTGETKGSGPTRLALVSTIQFVAAVQSLREDLSSELAPLPKEDGEREGEVDGAVRKVDRRDVGVWRGKYEVTVPQSRPLSPGEVLGCTAPKLKDVDALIYVGDGRFHLESIMIANPSVPAFRYDPYSKKFTRELYEHEEMRGVRADAVRKARKTLVESGSGSWAVVLGTLGRQGSLAVLKTIQSSLPTGSEPPLLLLLSELSPAKLALLPQLSTFVQTSCPRLSIDWGYAFDRPLLSPYEASVVVGRVKGWAGVEVEGIKGEGDYPMDFYADASLGPWTPRHRPVRAA
ncbi:Diphthamide biosynthesis protein 1 [Saitozyma sp. JCM 24511]|nr:Diphthamide biosynthesis protein 1 [Saitozyma sp. JCM 24511]